MEVGLQSASVGQDATSVELAAGTQTRSTWERPRVGGKFLFAGDQKLRVKGVTYGTFRADEHGREYPPQDLLQRDFALMAANGFNAVRTYTVPPLELLDAAAQNGLRVMVGLPWEQHVSFLEERSRQRSIEERVRAGVRACAGHPAVLCYAVGNEIPTPIVRWHGPRKVERFLRSLCEAVRNEDPGGLVTYVNYPSSEYLDLAFLDLICFNVYLEQQPALEGYLARLHTLAAEKPLVMAEIGLDSRRNGEVEQARSLDWQVRSVMASGCAGAFAFAWTDEWHRGGHDIEDWDFGLTDRARQPKLALAAVSAALGSNPAPSEGRWPRVSVVVCSYNGERTLRDCLQGLRRLDYPDYEVIVVDDGSTDATPAIAREHRVRLITTPNEGLSSARNTGMAAADGEIIAYIDDDASPDPDWLRYMALTFMTTEHAAVGGPNIAPAGPPVSQCVANAPGGPVHVLLSDTEAEHIPGCNMAFRRRCLEEVDGFDSRFRAAGDDVDLCWRLQERAWTIGFNPAAMVWHHRRDSLRAYWLQQRGYGRAEAMLERKWPAKYNEIGHITWRGRLYGKGLAGSLRPGRRRIRYGSGGSNLFQSVYQPSDGTLSALPLTPEWYLLTGLLIVISALGLLWGPLLLGAPLALAGVVAVLVPAARGGASASFTPSLRSRRGRLGMRALTALLHLAQPLARLHGRLSLGLTPWRLRGSSRRLRPPVPRMVQQWSEEWSSLEERLSRLELDLRAKGITVRRGSDFDRWDLETRVGVLGGVRVRAVVEEHGAGRQLARFRVWPRASRLGSWAPVNLGALAAFAYGAGEAGIATVCGGALLLLGIRGAAEASTMTGALLQTLEEDDDERPPSQPAVVAEAQSASRA